MTAAVPEGLLRQIVATYAPRYVILFGSHARGEAGPDSDLDILVVLDDNASSEALHWRRRFEARKGYDGAADILACRVADLADRAEVPGSLAATVLREGLTVYERA